eukprot:3017644-Rhodomonas_salina.1
MHAVVLNLPGLGRGEVRGVAVSEPGVLGAVVLVPFDGCGVFEVEELDGGAAGELKDDDELFGFASRRRVADDDAVRDEGCYVLWAVRPNGVYPFAEVCSDLLDVVACALALTCFGDAGDEGVGYLVMHEVLSLLCLGAVHHAMSEAVRVFPAEGTDGVRVALVSVVARDDGSCRKAEAPGLEEVSHSLFRECLVLEMVPEHFAAVTKREGIQLGRRRAGGGHASPRWRSIWLRGGEGSWRRDWSGGHIPLSVLAFCSCLGLEVCLLIARVSCVGFDPHYHGLRSCASVKGVDSCEDEIWVNFVFRSGLSVAFLPSRDHGDDGRAISVDGHRREGVVSASCRAVVMP